MKLIRWILGNLILLLNAAFPPKVVHRTKEAQAQVDRATQSLMLYQFESCPFCVKVRRTIRKLSLKIELKDAKDSNVAEALVRGGGQLQVPCLHIIKDDGKIQWLYESTAINAYLENRFLNNL